MGITNYEEERGDIQIVESVATKIYRKQLKDIHNIKDTEWYKQLKDYWIRVKESAEIELQTVNSEFLKITQVKRSIASDFVVFLDNLEKAPYIEQQAKQK